VCLVVTFDDNAEENSYVGTARCLIRLQSEYFNKLAASYRILDECDREKWKPLTCPSQHPGRIFSVFVCREP
jgi:hypothetical protein